MQVVWYLKYAWCNLVLEGETQLAMPNHHHICYAYTESMIPNKKDICKAHLIGLQSTYMSKDGVEISEVLTGVPEALQPLYREVMPVLCNRRQYCLIAHSGLVDACRVIQQCVLMLVSDHDEQESMYLVELLILYL